MKKITLFLIFTTLFSCKRDDNLSMVKKAKIGNLEVTGLEIQNKLWISNTNFLVDLTQKNIELYTEDLVSDFIKWKKTETICFIHTPMIGPKSHGL